MTELICHRLRREGYEVEAIQNPLEILGKARTFHPDLFILDVMMPDLDGLKLCRMIRADPGLKDVPIIFLTARGETPDRIAGLECGADDYMTKPFDGKELVLRVGLHFKRETARPGEIKDPILVVGPIQLDPERHLVRVQGEPVTLTSTEFKLLRLLMERRGRVQSREVLLSSCWNYEGDTESRTIDTHVRRLRDKLGSGASLIETVRGLGYRFRAS
jgi:two-component system, OmpR family, phosphate regulon response regulator PhoB